MNTLPKIKAREFPGFYHWELRFLFGISNAAHFPDNGDLDLSGILHIAFYFLGDIKAKLACAIICCFFSIDDNPQFPSSLDGVAFFDTVEAQAHVFELS